jgi:protein-S-isoprenylcysteine O-methyltransferase Ste14
MDRKAHVPSLPPTVARVLGRPLVGGGMALAVWFVRTMRGVDTTIRIDKPVSSLARMGRSATAATLAMIYAGIAVLRNALSAILLLPLVVYVIQREVIEREERYLERTFGEEYLTYKTRVRRWV